MEAGDQKDQTRVRSLELPIVRGGWGLGAELLAGHALLRPPQWKGVQRASGLVSTSTCRDRGAPQLPPSDLGPFLTCPPPQPHALRYRIDWQNKVPLSFPESCRLF